MRTLLLTTLLLSGPALAKTPAPAYVPAPAEQIPGYSEKRLPCKFVRGVIDESGLLEKVGSKSKDPNAATFVVCDGKPDLAMLSLRELSILRNTIHARYGWGGFRKPWLREYFQKQPWYKPDPAFTANRLSAVDRQNAELIAKAEMSLRMVDLEVRRDGILAEAGKAWGDAPLTTQGKSKVPSCEDMFAARNSRDCTHHQKPMKPAEPQMDKLTPEDRIELGLLSRAMGDFAVDDGQRNQLSTSLDTVLSVKELRQLSLRDLRLLRNTLFARRGRPFKSEMLQEHFAHMPWYKADPAYSDERLTKTDKLNIELIRQVEDEFGGALQDKDFQIDNPSQAKDRQLDPAAIA